MLPPDHVGSGRLAPTRASTSHYACALGFALTLAAGLSAQAYGQSAHADTLAAPALFNTDLLAFPVDVSMFAEGNPVPPGTRRVDVYLNEKWQGKRNVRFEAVNPGGRIAQACFDAGLLDMIGLDSHKISSPDVQARLLAGELLCQPPGQIVPGTRADFDANQQRLNVSAPQIALLRRPRGYVDPSRWDAGITAARLAWDYNGWNNRARNQRSQTSHYLGLRGGVNLGDWRLRYRASATHTRTRDDAGMHYRSSALYMERALPEWRSALRMGESTTRSYVFDSLGFRGLRLQSEASMRPDSMNGFAPVITGIAQSNARVSIAQLGLPIFETTVPPGPFVIDDLYPSGNGGDLRVTITEADGSERSFTVTCSSLPEMLRPGVFRYSVSLGRYRNSGLAHAPWFTMLSFARGINNTVTGYSGLLVGQGYQAASAGVGLNLPVGAVTVDASLARTGSLNTDGIGLRLGYAKHLSGTQTEFSVAMLRHATRGYYDPAQAFELRDALQRGLPVQTARHRRSQLSVNVNQQLPGAWGALSISASVQDYWQRSGHDVQYSMGYGRGIKRVNVSLNLMRSRNTATGRWDNQYLLALAIPLGQTRAQSLNTSLTHRPGGQTLQASLSGAAGERSQHTWSVYASRDKNNGQADQGSGGASAGTTTPWMRVNASVAAADGSQQLGLNASGGLVAFRDGVVFTPELGETVAIVQARHAQGATLPGYSGLRLDARGHAVVPYLRAWRENDIHLDIKGISTDVQLSTTSQKVAPTQGAIVLLQYATQRGYAMLATLRRPDGSAAPFAAGVFDAQDKNVGYVAQGGQALVRVADLRGQLQVRWGAERAQQCRFEYNMGDGKTAHRKATGRKMRSPQNTQPTSAAHHFRRVEATCS